MFNLNILGKIFNRKTLIKIFFCVSFALIIRYTAIHFELEIVNGAFWIKNSYLFLSVSTIISLSREIINLIIDSICTDTSKLSKKVADYLLSIVRKPFIYFIDSDKGKRSNLTNIASDTNARTLTPLKKTK